MNLKSPLYLVVMAAICVSAALDSSAGDFRQVVDSSGDAKIIQSESKDCEGIVITKTGRALFRNVLPFIYVSMENKSNKRREITLDLKWRAKGRTYFGSYNDSKWETFGPHPIRPGESTNFVVKKQPEDGLTLEEAVLAKCQ